MLLLTYTNNPPNAKSLSRALDALDAADDDVIFYRALFLALPITESPGTSVHHTGGSVTWRGYALDASLPLCDGVADLVRRGMRPTDRFFDLDIEGEYRVKIVYSGSSALVVGPQLLYGDPGYALSREVCSVYSTESLIDLVVLLSLDQRALDTQTVPCDVTGFVISGSEGGMRTIDLAKPLYGSHVVKPGCVAMPEASVAVKLEGLAEIVRATLDGDSVEVVDLGAEESLSFGEALVQKGEHTLVVPMALGASGEVVGVGRGDVIAEFAPVALPSDLLGEYRVVGFARYEDGVVVAHKESGLRCLVALDA